jgi:hypothetical protein
MKRGHAGRLHPASAGTVYAVVRQGADDELFSSPAGRDAWVGIFGFRRALEVLHRFLRDLVVAGERLGPCLRFSPLADVGLNCERGVVVPATATNMATHRR